MIFSNDSFEHLPDLEEVSRAITILFDPSEHHELRGLPSGRSRLICGGDRDGVLSAVQDLSDGSGVFYTLNPVREDLGNNAAKSADILKRRWILIDIDRCKHHSPDDSATEKEKGFVWFVSSKIQTRLSKSGWPDPVVVDSGNGYHLLYRIDLPNDLECQKLVAAVLRQLAKDHNTEDAEIDIKVHNPSRIAKLPGTWACKGHSSPDRPFRVARILDVPSEVRIVERSQLVDLVGEDYEVRPTNGHTSSRLTAETPLEIWLRRALEGECAKVALAPEGNRHDQLLKSSFALGGLLHAGLSRDEVEEALVLVGQRTDSSRRDHEAVVRDGLDAGAKKPREIPKLQWNGDKHVRFTVYPSSAEDQWEEPLVEVLVPPVPFPVNVFPPGVQDFISEGSECLGCPSDFLGVSCLAVASAAIGRSVSLSIKEGWIESPSIYAAIVGDPGSTKTPALNLACRALWNITEELLERHKEEVQRHREDDESVPKPTRITVDDATVESLGTILRDNPRGIIMIRDELTAWVSSLNQYKSGGRGSDRQFFLSAWAGSAVTVDRKSNPQSVPIHIARPFLSVLGALTPSMFSSFKEEKGRDDGFIDRLLVSYPEPVSVRWREAGIDPGVVESWEELIRRLWFRPMVEVEGNCRPFIVRFEPQAQSLFAEWFDAHNLESESLDFSSYLKGAWPKFRSYCARLALILELMNSQGHPPDVSVRSLEKAIQLIDYFKVNIQRVSMRIRGAYSENPDGRAILRWLISTQRDQFSERDVKRNFRARFRNDHQSLDDAISWLKSRRCIRLISSSYVGPGRPHSPTYSLNPLLLNPVPE